MGRKGEREGRERREGEERERRDGDTNSTSSLLSWMLTSCDRNCITAHGVKTRATTKVEAAWSLL